MQYRVRCWIIVDHAFPYLWRENSRPTQNISSHTRSDALSSGSDCTRSEYLCIHVVGGYICRIEREGVKIKKMD